MASVPAAMKSACALVRSSSSSDMSAALSTVEGTLGSQRQHPSAKGGRLIILTRVGRDGYTSIELFSQIWLSGALSVHQRSMVTADRAAPIAVVRAQG
jgi:hypothetical protein